MRCILLSWLLFTSLHAAAQSRPAAIRQVKTIFEDAMGRLDKLNGKPAQADIDYLSLKFDEAAEIWGPAYKNGDRTDQYLVLYFSSVFSIRMGYTFSALKKYDKAWDYYHPVAPMLKNLLQEGVFPLFYESDGYRYRIDQTVVTEMAPLFYMDMILVLEHLDKWTELEYVAKEALALKVKPGLAKYVASSYLITAGKKRAMHNDTLLNYYLENIKSLIKMDTASKSLITGKNIPGYEFRYKELTDFLPNLTHIKYDTYGRAAVLYWEEGKDTAKAKYLFPLAFSEGIGFNGTRTMVVGADFAIDVMDKELGLKIAGLLKEYPGIEKECNELSVIARLYKTFGNNSEARYYLRKHKQCLKK